MGERTENSEKFLDKILPIKTAEDLITRGIWKGPVIHERALQKLPRVARWSSSILTRLLGGHLIIKDTRQPVPAFISKETGAQIRQPEYIYPTFMLLSKTHWLLRTIFRAIIGEVLTPGYDIYERFKKKCTNCGKEYENPDTEKCEICEKTDFETPDVNQYKLFKQLIGEDRDNKKSLVGEGRTFKDFLYSTLWYLLALDDFYWELGHTHEFDTEQKKVIRTPRAVRVLDGALTQPVMDEFGNFTSTQYFCPVCYKAIKKETKRDSYEDLRSTPNKKPEDLKCKKCGEQLIQTAYVQKVDGKIVARFGKDEVIHDSSGRIDPDVFGLSKILASAKLLYIIDYMDEYNLQIYGHGHANMILGIEGADKHKITEIQTEVMNQLRSKTRRDVRTGESGFSLEPILVFIGTEAGKKIFSVDISPQLDKMQSIDYYRLYVEKVCGLFGVTPIFVNISEPGTTGFTARPRIDVQNRVTRQHMSDLENPFNDFLLPRLGITDWVLRFGKVESRDELRDKQILLTNIQAASIALKSGFEVDMAEDGRSFTISSKPVNPPESRSREDSGRLPQDEDGAPQRTMPTGTEQGVPIEEPEVGVNAE